MLSETLLLAAAVGSGVIAGVCFAFASFLMRSFDRLGAPQAIRTMQSLNAEILRSSTMVVWFGTVVLGLGAAVLAEERALAITAAVLYAIGALLITGRGNVPLNEALDRADPDAPDADQVWSRYRIQWGRWNAIRTAVCLAASATFVLAL